MRILVIGSAGHLGEALVRTLRNTSCEVVGLDMVASPFTSNVGSIANRSHVKRYMQGVDAVLHTATLHKPHLATHSRQDFSIPTLRARSICWKRPHTQRRGGRMPTTTSKRTSTSIGV